jgi:predicted transcriptional regulator
MRNVIVNTGTIAEYFARGRELAKQIDYGEVPKPEFTLTFEDPEDMFAVMSPARLELFRTAKADRIHLQSVVV